MSEPKFLIYYVGCADTDGDNYPITRMISEFYADEFEVKAIVSKNNQEDYDRLLVKFKKAHKEWQVLKDHWLNCECCFDKVPEPREPIFGESWQWIFKEQYSVQVEEVF